MRFWDGYQGSSFIGAAASASIPHLAPDLASLVCASAAAAPSPARHDRARASLRGRRRSWPATASRPTGYRVAIARHREGLRDRRLLADGDRRRRRARHRDGAPARHRARALREDRGRAPRARGQGQHALADDRAEPSRRDAGPGGRAALRGLRPPAQDRAGSGSSTSRAAATRRRSSTATGSGGLYARESLKKCYGSGDLDRDEALRMAVAGARPTRPTRIAATGGVDLARGIYPDRQALHAEAASSDASDDRDRAGLPQHVIDAPPPAGSLIMSMPFYVSPEQMMPGQGRVRPQGHRARQVHRHARVRRRHPDDGGEPDSSSRRSARSTTASPSPASASSASSTSSGRSASASPTSRATPTAATTCAAKALANAYSQVDRRGLHARDEAPRGRDRSWPRSAIPTLARPRGQRALSDRVRRHHQRPRGLLRDRRQRGQRSRAT